MTTLSKLLGICRLVRRTFAVAAKAIAAFVLLCGLSLGQTSTQLTLDQALDLAMKNSPTIQAARTTIDQNKAQETTAGLRPNPVLAWDTQFLPFFSPGGFTADNIDQTSQFDMG